LERDITAFMPNHCCAPKPTKNLNHNVKSRIKIVAVAPIATGTPKPCRRIVKAISGKPTSNGMPTGIDFTATKIAEITNIALQLI
jgi:hypothetical protein